MDNKYQNVYAQFFKALLVLILQQNIFTHGKLIIHGPESLKK